MTNVNDDCNAHDDESTLGMAICDNNENNDDIKIDCGVDLDYFDYLDYAPVLAELEVCNYMKTV